MKPQEHIERTKARHGNVWVINPNMRDKDGDAILSYIPEHHVPAFEDAGYSLYRPGATPSGIPPEAVAPSPAAVQVPVAEEKPKRGRKKQTL